MRDLDRAFQNWWGGSHPKPTWRKAGVNEGFYISDLSVRKLSHKWGEVLVPKIGWIRFRLTRTFLDIQSCSSARVTLDRSHRWHVSFIAPQPNIVREQTGAATGLDMYIASTVTTSDGAQLHMPNLLFQANPTKAQITAQASQAEERIQKKSKDQAPNQQAIS